MDIRIRVGAALDADAAIASARRVRQQLEAEFKKARFVIGPGGSGTAGGSRGGSSDPQQRALAQEAAMLMRNLRMRKQAAAEERREVAQAAADVMRNLRMRKQAAAEERREVAQAAADVMRNLAIRRKAIEEERRLREKAAREAARADSDAARAADRRARIRERHEREQRRLSARQPAIGANEEERFGRRTSYRAIHNTEALARHSTDIARDIARGAGVQFDIGTVIGGAVELERRAVDLSNSAFQERPGERRISPSELINQSRETGDRWAFDPNRVMAGLQAFSAKTGELEVGRAALSDLAELARATGTSLEDMIGSAGEASKALGDAFGSPQEKGTALIRILRVMAQQGKLGSVEFSDLAAQMGKMSAAAPQFAGSAERNVEIMGALAQFSMQGGGATSATQAATSVAGFANTVKTRARVRAFRAEGIDVFSDKEKGKLKDPIELIVESLKKTNADPMRMKAMFANVVGAKPVESLASTFREAGGGAAGEKAVRARFDTFLKSMSADTVHESAQRSLDTKEAQVQRFNNELGKVGANIAERVLPRLAEIGPAAVDVADRLGNLAAWVAENPLEAAITGFGAAIVKSVGESIIRAGIENALRNGGGAGGSVGGQGGAGGVGGVPANAGGKVLAGIGTVVTIAATAVTIGQVGRLIIDDILDAKNDAAKNTQEFLAKSANARLAVIGSADRGATSPETLKKLEANNDIVKARIAAVESMPVEHPLASIFGGALSGAANYVTAGALGTSFDAQNQREADKEQLSAMKEQLARNNELLQRIAGGIDVRVTEMPAMAERPPQPNGPRVDAAGNYIGGS